MHGDDGNLSEQKQIDFQTFHCCKDGLKKLHPTGLVPKGFGISAQAPRMNTALQPSPQTIFENLGHLALPCWASAAHIQKKTELHEFHEAIRI